METTFCKDGRFLVCAKYALIHIFGTASLIDNQMR